MAKSYNSSELRNVALIGPGGAGKTALADAILFNTGANSRLGRTSESTSLLDTEPEEIYRGGSITSHFIWAEHKDRRINFIDTPGDLNFVWDTLTSIQAANAAILVVNAGQLNVSSTKRAWTIVTERNLPKAIFVNKMDKATAKVSEILQQLEQNLNIQPLPVQWPLGIGSTFSGIVDLFSKKAYRWASDSSGKMTKEEVPADHQNDVNTAFSTMLDAIASTDDALLEKFLETGEMNEEQARKAFALAVKQNKIVPVYFGNAFQNIGVQPLLDFIAETFPSPLEANSISVRDKDNQVLPSAPKPEEPFLAQVVHTFFDEHTGQLSVIRILSGQCPKDGIVYNSTNNEEIRLGSLYLIRGTDRLKLEEVVCGDIVAAVKLKGTHTNDTLCLHNKFRTIPKIVYPKSMISYLVIPESKNDSDKLRMALEKLIEEDPTLSITVDDLSHHLVLNGMGNSHLEMAIAKMKRKSKVNVTTELPPIPYRETFLKPIMNVEGKHKKQTGGAGQFGLCFINVEPTPRGSGFEFVDKIHGGAIPRQFIPSVEKGLIERAKYGLLAGYPLVDFRVSLIDGKYHPVDSKDIAFQMAGTKALKLAMENAGLKILEPFYKMEIVVPTEKSGDVMGDITSRRGHVDGMDSQGENTVIRATCPQAEIQRYVPDLRAMTGGRGTFTMEFDSYKEVPPHMVKKIQDASPFKEKAAKVEE